MHLFYCDKLQFLGAFVKLRKATIDFLILSLRPSVRLSACNTSTPTEGILMKFDIWVFSLNLLRKFEFHQNATRITGIFHEDQHIFLIITRSLLLRMRNVSDKSCGANQTHMLCSCIFLFFFRKSCRLWENVEKRNTARQATDDSMAQVHYVMDT
jgi:hypothetical protein